MGCDVAGVGGVDADWCLADPRVSRPNEYMRSATKRALSPANLRQCKSADSLCPTDRGGRPGRPISLFTMRMKSFKDKEPSEV